jgi:hypothetical protein
MQCHMHVQIQYIQDILFTFQIFKKQKLNFGSVVVQAAVQIVVRNAVRIAL